MAEKTQCETILEFVQKEPNRIWYAKDFQAGEKFVGYEAGPRLCDLVSTGYMESLGKVHEDGTPGGKYTGYKLLKEIIIKTEPRKPSKAKMIRDAFIAGRNSNWNPAIGMFVRAEDLADEYMQNLSL